MEPAATEKALSVLEDLKNGVNSQRFIDSLPNRSKFVQKILKEEIDNIGKKIRDAVKFGTERKLVDDVIKDISEKLKDLSSTERKVLLNTIRVELANTIGTVRDDVLGRFKSRKYSSSSSGQKIQELDEMSNKSINEIKEYLKLESRKIQNDPEGIKILKKQARESERSLQIK